MGQQRAEGSERTTMLAATHNAAGVSTGSLVNARGCRQTVKLVEMTTRRRGQAEEAQGRCCRHTLDEFSAK